MIFVLDASVILATLLPDEHSDLGIGITRRLASSTALAPTLWAYEVVAGLRAAERRGRINPDDAARAVALVETLPIEQHQPRGTTMLRLSRQADISPYDTAYLAVALDNAVPLATLDQRLRDAAVALGVALVA